MRKIFFLAFVIFSCFVFAAYRKNFSAKINDNPRNQRAAVVKANFLKLDTAAKHTKTFAQKNGYNTEVAFIVNMAIHSGKPRFFVYNLTQNKIVDSGLVTHGQASNSNDEDITFSNQIGGYATSLGKYSIGKEYVGKFGTAFKLHGLDSSNSNAFKRFVVLHAHSCVPATSVYPFYICLSQGCPTVHPQFLLRLKTIINKSDQPILLNIICE
jgi:hypothetical protein